MSKIKTNVDVLEMMIFFWESVADREKITDEYFISIADKAEMSPVYCDDFTKDSVRKVLSAISNHEKLNDRSKKDSRFWNNNMWMLEDLEVMRNMMAPIKTLNLNDLAEKNTDNAKFDEVIFVPGHEDEFYLNDRKLYINFFKLMPNFENPKEIKISGMDLKSYIKSKYI